MLSFDLDLNGFRSKINRHLLFLGSFQTGFPHGFNLFLLFLVTPCFVVADEPFMEWIPIKKNI